MTRMTGVVRFAAIAGLLFVAASAQIGFAQPVWAVAGDYTFSSYVTTPNGAPVCMEHWRFGEDGIKTIFRGDQSLRMKSKFETDGKVYYLVEEKLDATQQDDCLSGLRPDVSTPRRYPIVRLNGGGFFICKRLVNPLNVSDCYGRAFPEHSARPN